MTTALALSGKRWSLRMELNSVLRRNIETLRQKRLEEELATRRSDRFATRISSLAGSMGFIVAHAVAIVSWIVINRGLVPLVPPFDPTFVVLATTASVEALFLSAFILVAQNRAAMVADKRSDLDVQISLLTEHEVTRVLTLCTEIAERLDIRAAQDPDLDELKRDVAPEHVIDEIASTQVRADADN